MIDSLALGEARIASTADAVVAQAGIYPVTPLLLGHVTARRLHEQERTGASGSILI
jgi:hypothetical protein